ncbi:hypothetical protein V1505DRAFT_33597 [Lipomyces doorenjongii]
MKIPPEEITLFQYALKNWAWRFRRDQEEPEDLHTTPCPLLFTSTALLRLVYVRLLMDIGPTRSLSTWDPETIARSIDRSVPVQRSEGATSAAFHCAHILSIPIKLGIDITKTHVRYWPLEHALCSLECAVLLARWLESVLVSALRPPLSKLEEQVLIFIKQLVTKWYQSGSPGSLLKQEIPISAAVVMIWARLYQSNSEWGTIDLIGRSFAAYAELLKSRHVNLSYVNEG